MQTQDAGVERAVQLHFHFPAVHIHTADAAVRLSGAAVFVSYHGCLCGSLAPERAA
jgi:hypothetical protein